jgi:hypothetical protein
MSLKLAIALAIAATSLSPVAQAATQFYSAQGALAPLTGTVCTDPNPGGCPASYAFMEVWGPGPSTTSAYANPATNPGDPFSGLIASSSALSNAVLGGFTGGSAGFGYDPTVAPYFVSANGRNARYETPPMTVQMSGVGGATISLSDSDTKLTVNRNGAGTAQNLTFTNKANTVDGPIPGSTFSYSAPSSSTSTVDLVALMGPTAYFVQGFDLSAFSTLPVRLTTPSVFRPVGFVVYLQRSQPGANFTTAPPASLSLSDYFAANLYVYFDGIYGVTVDPSDYPDSTSFAAASNWVGANIRQINFEQSLDYTLSSITPGPVPEPGTWALLLAGLFSVAGVARRRAAGH